MLVENDPAPPTTLYRDVPEGGVFQPYEGSHYFLKGRDFDVSLGSGRTFIREKDDLKVVYYPDAKLVPGSPK